MGRRPCCEKTGAGGGGVKKGPWTPEEDIILVSYIHQNGPGNWKSVPTNTGLSRCSKSCRLRWTNYLRPGIKRGSFTHHEEKLIFHLQALLGNRWAAIASYVPQRTDNDIKNYWNTHLKKKLLLRKQLAEEDDDQALVEPKGQWERRLQTDINMAKQALHDALYMDRPTFLYDLLPADHVASTYSTTTTSSSSTTTPAPSTYASSTENISRLLQNWTTTKPGPNKIVSPGPAATGATTATLAPNNINVSSPAETTGSLSFHCRESKQSAAEPLFPFSMLETWLFDDTSSFLQGGHDMIHADHMPPIF